ncbi:MAG: long-chain-fatty-acyl-CoA reductase [Rhodospirillaceae bacterium]|nr:MAG: long-chain-fatty-acyl-CoA reductase [Rhodospirillaceae bacterium]
MNIAIKTGELPTASTEPLRVHHFVRGALVEGNDVRYTSRDLGADFTTPAIDLDALITPRSEPGPLFDVKISEIIDFLVETGERMDLERNVHLQECAERTAVTNPLPRRVIDNLFRQARNYLNKKAFTFQIERNFGNPAYLDGWVPTTDPFGNKTSIRAFPPRLIHVLAGNSPTGAVASIAQGALVKAVNLFKMPSSDPFTAVAILRTMAEVDPNHPLVRSMSAVYWRGGDAAIERTLYRPQYFDKIVAWGGGDAINNVIKYLGPGFQLISFDPKASISMVGVEAFASDATIEDVAERAAADVTVFNQEACLASRYIFMEGSREQVDRFCEKLLPRLGVDRQTASAIAPPLPGEMREEIEVLQAMGDSYRVWGGFDGRGMVIRSEEPVEFHPTNKTANVVQVASLADAVKYVNVATQTVGVFPFNRKAELRDRLATAGAQRVVRLGGAGKHGVGGPHDAMYPLQRFVHWMVDEDI